MVFFLGVDGVGGAGPLLAVAAAAMTVKRNCVKKQGEAQLARQLEESCPETPSQRPPQKGPHNAHGGMIW